MLGTVSWLLDKKILDDILTVHSLYH